MPVDSLNFVNDQYLTQIRASWRKGEFPAACIKCKKAESTGGSSRRTGSNQWYTDNRLNNQDVELVRLDYWTGDLCNLACAICGPAYSSLWKQELNMPAELKKVVVNQSWKDIDLSKLRLVHFHGGEPLLSKEHVKFLHNIPRKDQVHLTYNTNGTIRPKVELLELWGQFRLVELAFSIDDIEEQFEYQRYPAKWNTVKDNLQWFLDNGPHNCMFAVLTSVGILNHNNIPRLNTWLQEHFYVNKFTDPIEHRQQLTSGNLSLTNAKQRANQIMTYLDTLDARRHINWRLVFPELENYLTQADVGQIKQT